MILNDSAHASPNCANCGAEVSEQFCPRCGQSRDDIKRPFWSLATDTLDGLLSWDGRLLTTLRQLYTRPGQVARDYADGKRSSFTAPVRLYVIVSLVFFAAMTISGVRIFAVDTVSTETGPGVSITMFQPPRTNEPPAFTAEERAEMTASASELGVDPFWINLGLYAADHPSEVESKAAAAANQAMILMVFVFILVNMALHPHARIIEHTIHALYYHAAFLPIAGAVLIVGVYMNMSLSVALAVLVAGLICSMAAYYLFDRGFYGSSWWGAILRAVTMSTVYGFAMVCLSLGLIVLATL